MIEMKSAMQVKEIDKNKFLGGTRHFARSPVHFIESMLRDRINIAASKILLNQWYFLCDPEAIDHVLNKHSDNYVHSRPYEAMKCFLGDSLMTNEGADWVISRKTIKPLFTKERNRLYQKVMIEEALSGFGLFSEQQPVNITQVIRNTTLNVLCRSILGIHIDEKATAIGENLRIMQSYSNKKMRSLFYVPLIRSYHRKYLFQKCTQVPE